MFSDLVNIFSWWLSLSFLGWIFTPFLLRLFPHFWDKGWLFSKILGLAVFSFFSFLLSFLHLLPFYREALFLQIFLVALLVWFYFYRFPSQKLAFRNFLHHHFRLIITLELFAFFAFILWALVRSFAPQIEGLEKYMDWGFINSILRSTWLPPADMWFAGSSINYYWFGHLMFALLTKLSAVDSAIAYNLSLATVFSLVFTLSFSLSSNLLYSLFLKTKKTKINFKPIIVCALISSLFLTLGGNLHLSYKLLKLRQEKGSFSQATASYWYPDATRFIGFDPDTTDKTIHEFPLYSFVVSDLHGHLNDVPIVLLFLALLFSLSPLIARSSFFAKLAPLSLLAFLLSLMYMTNAWDFAVYGLMFAFFSFLSLFSTLPKTKNSLLSLPRFFFKQLILPGATLLILWFVFTLPFSLNFTPMAEGIRISDAHSPFYQLFILHGGFWLVCFPPLLFLIFSRFFGFLKKYEASDIFVLSLVILATLLIIIPELVYLKDIYIFEHRRANTMFKLVYQSFILYSLASGYLLLRFKQLTAPHSPLLIFYKVIFLFVFVSHLAYPYFALRSYYGSFKNYRGLYGLNFLKERYPDNWEAVVWLNKNLKGQPVLLEAAGDSYTDYNHISAATGLPTIQGWLVHEWLWRGGWDEPGSRAEEVRQIYESKSPNEVAALLNKYQVEYILVGPKEREKYPNLNQERIESTFRPFVSFGDTVIYKVQ